MKRQRKKTRLSPEGWYCLALMGFLVAGTVLREMNLLLLICALLVGVLLWSWRQAVVSLRKLEFRRELPRVVTAGEPLVVDIHVTNGRKRRASWAVVVEDTIVREIVAEESSLGEAQKVAGTLRVPQPADGTRSVPATFAATNARVVFARVGPRTAESRAYEGRLPRRGMYHFGPLFVSTRFPLGLVRRSEVIDETTTLLVLPRPGRLTPRWRHRHQSEYYGSRSRRSRQGLHEGDFHSLRDYRPGDSSNWIHWRTSARQGALMVRQFEQQQNNDLALFLHLWQADDPTQKQRESVELAVSFAATILADQCRRGGHQLLLGIAGEGVSISRGPASTGLLGELLHKLALAEASPQDHWPRLLEEGLQQTPPRCDRVLISTRPRAHFPVTVSGDVHQSANGRMLTIDASSDELFEYYDATPVRSVEHAEG